LSAATELPETPSFGLEGKRALVTGGSKGLGLACGAALANAGAEVTLLARTATEVEEAAEAIRAAGGKAHGVSLDITLVEPTADWVAKEPAFNILVNNAGTNRPGPFVETSVKDYDDVFGINVRAAFFLSQAVAKRMIADGAKGSIINMSSQMGHIGAARRTVYCATKHAMEGFTRAMAAELGPHGIRVNTIAPTFIETPMTKPFFENEVFLKDTLARIKLGRLGQIEDLMGAVVFLASEASALMNGTSMVIDGCWTAE
jgi:NAD(P)-dependent dehydrogenase (short-subunit alcohol dehydrogenase family)